MKKKLILQYKKEWSTENNFHLYFEEILTDIETSSTTYTGQVWGFGKGRDFDGQRS